MNHETSLWSARNEYFEANNFGPDGGYSAQWVDFKLGPLPFPIPNSPPRRAVVPFHDLHHVLTGYATDFLGELEISAWEIGAGCHSAWFAWQVNTAGLACGLLIAPQRTLTAFAWGLQCNSLYGNDDPRLLGQTVRETREQLGMAAPLRPLNAKGWAQLGLAFLSGTMSGIVQFLLLIPLVPVGLVVAHRRASNEQSEQAPARRA